VTVYSAHSSLLSVSALLQITLSSVTKVRNKLLNPTDKCVIQPLQNNTEDNIFMKLKDTVAGSKVEAKMLLLPELRG